MAVPSSPAKTSAAEDSEVRMAGSGPEIQTPEDPDSKSAKKAKVKELKKQFEKDVVVNGSGGGGIYEGKTCHQCRQKIVVLAVGCKNLKKDKQCPMRFCCKCLLNRYGETAADMEAIDDWKCPKCRGICNCSSCMKKRGLLPTGILVHAAKENGFSSVSQLLDAKGPEACQQLTAKKKRATPAEGPVLVGTCDANLNSQPPFPSTDESRIDKPSLERLEESGAEVMGNAVWSSVKLSNSQENAVRKESQKQKAKIKPHKLDALMNERVVEEVVLPPGTLLASVSGVDLLPIDVGDALQFMEFCAAFGEVLDIRKGQPESVLRDIMSERGRRKGKYSSAVQFFIQLLSFILRGEEGSVPSSPDSDKDSWLSMLKKCISESDCMLKDIPKDCFDQGHDGYEMLEPSRKLKLLTFLCDEALCTIEARNWIEKQHSKFVEKLKGAREALNAAKEKERLLKLKLQGEASKDIIAQNEDLQANNSEQNSIGEIKGEIDQAHEEIMKATESLPKKRRSDALRTEPIFLDDKGRVLWTLNCLSDSDLLLQDIGDPCYQSVSSENWFTYDAEESKKIRRNISKSRRSKRRIDKLNDSLMFNTNSDIEPDSSSNDDTPPTVNDN